MISLASALSCALAPLHSDCLRPWHAVRALPPVLQLFDVDEAKRRMETAVAREDYAEAARMKKAIEELVGANPPSQPKQTWIRPLGMESEPAQEELATDASDKTVEEESAQAEERWMPEPGRFFSLPEKTTELENPRTEGYWAPLLETPDRLRSSDLNELLEPDHLERLRFTNSPMMAYGALFKWDVLVQNVMQLFMKPWEMVAAEHSLEPPDEDAVMRSMGMRSERAIQQIFRWTDDWGFSQRLAFEHFEAQRETFKTFEFVPAEGALEWLYLLNNYSVPCCCCASSIDTETAKLAMARAGMDELFDEFVTAEDDCETAEQCFLVASVKVSCVYSPMHVSLVHEIPHPASPTVAEAAKTLCSLCG